MTESTGAVKQGGDAVRWTCPFCLLLCDVLQVRLADAPGDAPVLALGDCAGAQAGLARFGSAPSAATPQVDGRPAALDDALAAAARLLAASRQPLFGGLGCDVAGARALYRLACASGAICDAAEGAALMEGVRAMQDRGGFGSTLAELRTRADVFVCVGSLPRGGAADFFPRCGLGEAGLVAQRHVVLLGEGGETALAALGALPGVTVQALPPEGDLFDSVALLAARLAGRGAAGVHPAIDALAARLQAARYAVFVGQTAELPPHGGLIIEAIGRIVGSLNGTTRAAALWLGGDRHGMGAGTVNEVFTWLSGLPLRTRAGPWGLEHEPLCFDAGRLLAEGAVDSLLWLSCFDPDCTPPPAAAGLPLVLLGHPGLARLAAAGQGAVFIPVATPGIGTAGHLLRADGGTLLPLVPLYRDSLPRLDAVLDGLARGVQALRAGAELAP